jgi:hypothetical protein
MDVYFCKPCKYYSKAVSSFKNHIKSKSHINNCGSKKCTDFSKFKKCMYICSECDDIYTSQKSLNNHICKKDNHTCKKITQPINADTIHVMQTKIDNLEAKILNKDKNHSEQLSKALDIIHYNSETLNTALEIIESSGLFVPDEEEIKNIYNLSTELTDCNTLDDLLKLNLQNMLSYDEFNEDINMCKSLQADISSVPSEISLFLKIIINKHEQDLFPEFIGDILLNYYDVSHTSTSESSNEDISESINLIMSKIKNKNKFKRAKWEKDKTGEKFIDIVLNPIMNSIGEIITDFINVGNYINISDDTLYFMAKCAEIKKKIENDKFTKYIVEYVSDELSFDNVQSLDSDSDNSYAIDFPKKIIIRKKYSAF